MPIYEFECGNCQESFERLVFKNDRDKIACPGCGQENVKRLMSASTLFGSNKGGELCSPGGGGRFS